MQIKVNVNIYPLEAILNTCYDYLDEAYIYLDIDSNKKIVVSFKPKNRISDSKFNKMKKRFLNDLLHFSLRCQVNKENKRITEYIINRALYSSIYSTVPNRSSGLLDKLSERVEEQSNIDDRMGIAIPWEEKYGRKTKSLKKL